MKTNETTCREEKNAAQPKETKMSKTWQVWTGTEGAMAATTKGTKAVCEGTYKDLREKAQRFELPKGLVIQLVELEGSGAKVLNVHTTSSRAAQTASSIRCIARQLEKCLAEKAEHEKEMLERIAKDGFAETIRWCADRTFEKQGAHRVYSVVQEECGDLLKTFGALDAESQESAAPTVAKALATKLNELIAYWNDRLIGQSEWVPSCTNAFDNAGRAYTCRGEADAIRHDLKVWASMAADKE